ncbi:MAG: DUF1588 domain-containing protein [Planctomycetales bacterium]|nr:DUF1588 domain-containing protein [Planctomycetales bacterium]
MLLLILPGNDFAWSQEESFRHGLMPVIQQNCVHCHDDDAANAELNFQELQSNEDFLDRPVVIEKILKAIDNDAMPPDGEPALDDITKKRAVESLRSLLRIVAERADQAEFPVSRLNRFQYNNTVRDLFHLDRDVFALPEKLMTRHVDYLHRPADDASEFHMPDTVHVESHSLRPLPGLKGVMPFPKDLRAEHGFDNQASQLTLSPLLLDAFLRLSVSIVESPDFNPRTVGIWNDFFAAPDPQADLDSEIRRRLRSFLRIAFRGPVDDATIDRYTAYAVTKINQHASFPDAMKKVAAAALSSPLFLYRSSATEPTEQAFALASRLSYFLWGSCPDEDLLLLAEAGKLNAPRVLDDTISRMLADPKIERFLDSFPTQWMQLENVLASTPNPQINRYFALDRDRPASLQMVLEPLLLFDAVFLENRPVVELLSPEFTYQSDLLAAWYHSDLAPPSVNAIENRPDELSQVPVNIDPKSGLHTTQQLYDDSIRAMMRSREFHRVPIRDPKYGGIITNAAVLSMTSGPNRTHPVARGVWVIEVIFNDPPQPPPNDVPPLDEDSGNDDLTIREQFAVHRNNPSCAGCHSKLDPLGFALENYDITGRWRDKYENGRTIDASGTLLRKHEFSGAASFKTALVHEERRFAKAFTEHLLRFALAQQLSPTDTLVVEDILNRAADGNYRLQTLLQEIIRSSRFRSVGR